MSAATPFAYNSLQPYDPPPWAKDLKYHPTEYIQVAPLMIDCIILTSSLPCQLIWYFYSANTSPPCMQLAMRPTPLHRWQLPGVPAEFQVWIKRDDMTGSTLSGNKV